MSRPSADVPANFKESANFTPAQPGDALAKGKWWEVYQDPQLNSLEEQIAVSNQTLKAAQAQFLQARAAVRVTPVEFLSDHVRQPGNLTHRAVAPTNPFSLPPKCGLTTISVLPVDVSYEADVWGRVRRTVEAEPL